MPDIDIAREELFHDAWAESIDIDAINVCGFDSICTLPETAIIAGELGDLTGKRVLELGAGAGEASVYFAMRGAHVVATDLSGGMLRVAQRLAEKHGVQIETVKTRSDHLVFADESFDVVYAANLLHHVDIDPTLQEVRRVLKNGGVFASWDPLAHNPAINIYRRIATEVRTEDEHPLTMRDLERFRGQFRSVTWHGTWLFTLLIFVKFYFLDRIDPNKTRYWKLIVDEQEHLAPLYKPLKRLDDFVLRVFPFMKRYCWNAVVIAQK